MGIIDYFKPVDTMTVDEVRKFLKAKNPDEYNLVDVRQPKEYERAHLPGARLIPVADLPDRLNELDLQKPTITYCAAGVRSRAAASVLKTAGFQTVHSMAGGINAWEGLEASGPPEAGMAVFPADAKAGELIGVAWLLEEGSRRFYEALAKSMKDGEAQQLFHDLVVAEEKHKMSLQELYVAVTDAAVGADFPKDMPRETMDRQIMEGGVKLSEALSWAEGKDASALLDLSIALEIASYDLYIKMGRQVEGEEARSVFDRLVKEERMHIGRMTDLLDLNAGQSAGPR